MLHEPMERICDVTHNLSVRCQRECRQLFANISDCPETDISIASADSLILSFMHAHLHDASEVPGTRANSMPMGASTSSPRHSRGSVFVLQVFAFRRFRLSGQDQHGSPGVVSQMETQRFEIVHERLDPFDST